MNNRAKRQAIRTSPTEESGLFSAVPIRSPPSLCPKEDEYRQEWSADVAKSSVLRLLQCAKMMSIFRESVNRFKGTNQPVNYRQEYDFAEKWEETSKARHERNSNLLLSAGWPCLLTAILVMLHKLPFLWYLSVQQLFTLPDDPGCLLSSIVIITVDMVLKIYLLARQASRNPEKQGVSGQEAASGIFAVVGGDLLTVAILLVKSLTGSYSLWQLGLDLVAMVVQWARLLEIYQTLTIMLIAQKYKNHVNLFGFISKMFVMLHLFAMLVYSVSFLSPENNWLQAINKHSQPPIVQYVYSVYFTATTMFTVGYGDILPCTVVEIIVIVLMQLLGIILIGYIVSEIGHTLAAMREAQEEFQHDLQNSDRVCEYYQLGDDLKHRVRNYIVNHQLANEQLNINEENHFLMKLNEELRNQVKHANHLQIIKTSLFFLCNWSKKMQSELSKKLEKFIFSPNERLPSKDKLFIVTKGKVDVYIERKQGTKLYVKKHLKTVQRAPDRQVFSNVYGCVSLFTGKPSRLSALSKDFVITYALDFSDILDMLHDDQRDLEFYHETRTQLELETVPEKFEVPNLINNRQHYCPTRTVVLHRHHADMISHQERETHVRSSRRKRTVIVEQKDAEVEESDSQCLLSAEELSIMYKTRQQKRIEKEKMKRYPPKNSPTYVSFRSYRRKHTTMVQDRAKEEEIKRLMTTGIVQTSYFQVGKDFQRYFKKGNRQAVLSKINRNQIKDFQPVNSKVMSMEWLDLIIFANKISYKESAQKKTLLG